MKTPGTAEERERQRYRAMALVREGRSSAQVAAQLGVDPRTVRRWKSAHRKHGEQGLRVKKAPGAKPRLSAQQRNSLRRRLLSGAEAQGFPTELWTCPRIAELIERVYRVDYHVDHIPYVMKSLGFSVQRPERRAEERDEAAIAHWVTRRWPRVKKTLGDGRPRWFSSMKRACF